MNRRVWSSVFLLMALIVLSLPYLSFTGAVISEIPNGQSIISIISLVFFIASVFLFLSRKSLDAIIIPTGGGKFDPKIGMWSQDKERTERAINEKDTLKDNGYFLISGYKGEGFEGMRKGQTYRIYKYLRDNGFFPKDIRVEGKSHDTEQNILYTLKKMKEMEERGGRTDPLDIGISTYPDHFKRFKDFYEEAIKKGLIEKDDFRLHEIPMIETDEEKRYENALPRKLLHSYQLRTMGRYKKKGGGIKYNLGTDKFIEFIRNIEKIIRGKRV